MKVNLAVMSIGIDYFQVLSMFSKAKVRWPEGKKSGGWLIRRLIRRLVHRLVVVGGGC